MTIEHFFTALTAAIPAIGAALLALWRVYVKQKADFSKAETDAAASKEASRSDHEEQDKKLDELLKALKRKETSEMRAMRQRIETLESENAELRKGGAP